MLGELDKHSDRYGKLLAALREHSPDTDEAADSIVRAVIAGEVADPDDDDQIDDEADEDEETEDVESLLDGAPPVLPPPTTPPEPQKLAADTEWFGRGLFEDAVANLRHLRTKPAARFVGISPPTDLSEVADFLLAVKAAQSVDREGGSSGVIASSDAEVITAREAASVL